MCEAVASTLAQATEHAERCLALVVTAEGMPGDLTGPKSTQSTPFSQPELGVSRTCIIKLKAARAGRLAAGIAVTTAVLLHVRRWKLKHDTWMQAPAVIVSVLMQV